MHIIFLQMFILCWGFFFVVVSVVLLLQNMLLQTSMKARQRDCRKPLHIITCSMCKKCSVVFAIVEINTKINKKKLSEKVSKLTAPPMLYSHQTWSQCEKINNNKKRVNQTRMKLHFVVVVVVQYQSSRHFALNNLFLVQEETIIHTRNWNYSMFLSSEKSACFHTFNQKTTTTKW